MISSSKGGQLYLLINATIYRVPNPKSLLPNRQPVTDYLNSAADTRVATATIHRQLGLSFHCPASMDLKRKKPNTRVSQPNTPVATA